MEGSCCPEVTLPCSISRDNQLRRVTQFKTSGRRRESSIFSWLIPMQQRWVSTRPLGTNSRQLESISSRCEELHHKLNNYCISAGRRTSPQLCLLSHISFFSTSKDKVTSLKMLVPGTGARTPAGPSSSPPSPVMSDLRLLPKPTQEKDFPFAFSNSTTTAEKESIRCTHSIQEMRNTDKLGFSKNLMPGTTVEPTSSFCVGNLISYSR